MTDHCHVDLNVVKIWIVDVEYFSAFVNTYLGPALTYSSLQVALHGLAADLLNG